MEEPSRFRVSQEECTKRRLPPPKPAVRVKSNSVGARVTLTWETDGDAHYFEILRRDPGASGFLRVGATSRTHLVDAPPISGTYEYRVVACNETGPSPMAEIVSVAFFPAAEAVGEGSHHDDDER